MANKKINELVSRTPSLSDLMLVGDPSSGYSYKCTVTALATIIETDIADGYVTLATAQTISGAKTFSNVITATTVPNTPTDPDKFLTLNSLNVITYRTGAQVLSDIGAQAALTNPVTGTGTTNYLPKFTGTSTIGNSQLIDDGTTIFLGTSGSLPNVKMIISTTSQRALELNSTTGNALFVSSGGAYVMTVTNGTWSTQFTQAGRLDLGGDLSITTIANATTDTDKFLVSDAGVVKYRTGAEVLSDIGGASSSSISGTTNYIPKFTSSSAIGNSAIYDNGGNIGINTTSAAEKLVVKVATNQNLEIRAASSLGAFTGVALDALNDARTTVVDLALRGTNLSLQSSGTTPMTFYINGSEQMRLTSTGLGIGTSSPASKLDVVGDAYVSGILQTTGGDLRTTGTASDAVTSGPLLAIRNTSNAYQYLLQLNASYGLDFWNYGGTWNKRMTLDASGNLGLGVTPSAWNTVTALQVGNTHLAGYSSDYAFFGTNGFYQSGWKYISNGYANRIELNGGAFAWYQAPSGTAGNAISFTQAMTLDASGRLGIGTTTPYAKLTTAVSGTFTTNSNDADYSTYGLWIADQNPTNAIGGAIGFGSSTGRKLAAIAAYHEADADQVGLKFYVQPSSAGSTGILTEAMYINSAGNLGLGVTPSAWSSGKAIEVAFVGNALWSNAGDNTILSNNAYNISGTGWVYARTAAATNYSQVAGEHRWSNAASGTAGNAITFTRAMTLDASGNLLVGSTSASGFNSAGLPLIVGNGSGNKGITIYSGNTSAGSIHFADGASNLPSYAGYINYNHSTNSMQFGTDNTEYMRITSAGNVRLSGTAPNAEDVVNKIDFYNNTSSINLAGIEGRRTAGGSNYGSLIFNTTNSGTSSEKMRITSSGNVGIGVTAPSDKLSVITDGNTTLEIGSASTGLGARILSYDRVANVSKDLKLTANLITFNTGSGVGSERMRITSTADILFGTQGAPNGTSIYGSGFIGGYSSGLMPLFQASSTTAAVSLQRFYNPNGNVGSIQTSGSSTSYVTSSDYRLKQDLKDFNGLSLVNQINVYDFQWKVDSTRSYGVMAHELQSVLPDAVTGVKDGEDMQGVDYSKIVPILIKSIQELKAEIETLKNK